MKQILSGLAIALVTVAGAARAAEGEEGRRDDPVGRRRAELATEGVRGPEISAEISRLGTQGSMEMSQALFNGAAFTPYGPGQYTPTPELPKGSQQAEPQQELDRGNREM